MLACPRGSSRSLEGGPEKDVFGHFRNVLLRRSVGRNGVEDEGRLACDQELIVGGRGPAEHFGGQGLLEQVGHVLHRLHRVLVLQDHVLPIVLNGGVERPEQGPFRHVRVQLLGDADAHLDALLALDLRAVEQQVLPGLGTVRLARLFPHRSAVIARIDGPSMAESVELLRVRVVRAPCGERHLLAEPSLSLLIQVGEVHDTGLEIRGGVDELDYVMAPACRDLGGESAPEVGERDVIDDDRGVVLLAPLLRI